MEIDLLSNPKLVNKWVPRFWCCQKRWKVFSGKWKIEPPDKIVCLGETTLNTGENISLIGSSDWSNYTIQVNFKILTESINPPEGGVICYSHFKNFKNYYSFHFCLFKNKIELIKRVKGVWNTIADQNYSFEIHKEYYIVISSIAGFHECWVNGTNYLKVNDNDVSEGYIGIGSKFCDVEFSHASVLL